MPLPKRKKLLVGLALTTLLSACDPAMVTGGRGCTAYAEARLGLPPDEVLVTAPIPVLSWINLTDARMTGACRP